MKQSIRAVLLLCSLLSLGLVFTITGVFVHQPTDVPDVTPQGTTPELSVVTWNLEWFPGKDEETRTRRFNQIRKAIREIDADIYLLQEMQDGESVEKLFEGVEGYEIHIVSQFRYGNFPAKQQLAIVSRFPAKSAFAESFVSTGGSRAPPRGFAFAALDIGGEHPLLVYTCHLKANGGDPERNIRLREESARQMVAHVEDMQADFPEAMVVIGGDFNLLLNQADMAHERTVEILKEAGFVWGWEGVAMNDRVTWPSDGRYPDASFDMFMFRGVEGRCSVLVRYEELSDHLPVFLSVGI
jgi:endonuclease/exonuclease/phosphatase family metal-dependent hydrolase